jgi:hypothetical protein
MRKQFSNMTQGQTISYHPLQSGTPCLTQIRPLLCTSSTQSSHSCTQVRGFHCYRCDNKLMESGYYRNRTKSYSAFALPVEASLIGPPTPHISAPKALVCLGWARAFLPRLLAPWSQLCACLPLRVVAPCSARAATPQHRAGVPLLTGEYYIVYMLN